MPDESDSWLEGIGVNVSGILGRVQDAATPASGAVEGAASAAYDTASSAASDLGSALGNVSDSASGAASSAYNAAAGAVGAVSDAANSAPGALTAGYDAASGAVSDTYDAASTAIQGVGSAATNEFGIQLDTNSLDAGSDEQPNLTTDPAVPFDVNADSATDFFKNAAKQMGGNVVGHLEIPDGIKCEPETDGQGRIVKVNLTARSKIMRPRLAGHRPRPGISSEEVLKKAEQLVLQHEMQHRKILEDHMRQAVKTLKGKPASQFDRLFKQIVDAYEAAQAAFDAREGSIKVVFDNTGKEVDVVTAPL